MTTQQEIEDFWLVSQRRALKRFLEIPELPSGFYPGEFATRPGREVLVQEHDFEQEQL